MGANTTELTDSNFDEQIKTAAEPVLVDFWAEWCGPCKTIAPILDEIGAEYAGKIRIAKVNIDEALGVSQRFEVMSIPTLILFKDGEPIWRTVGSRGKSQLVSELEPLLLGAA